VPSHPEKLQAIMQLIALVILTGASSLKNVMLYEIHRLVDRAGLPRKAKINDTITFTDLVPFGFSRLLRPQPLLPSF
jgi:hypothetical protein